jgi:N6-adenosine-specific RNA methylase IME4
MPSLVSKQELRAAREAELASRQRALPQARFGVIVADPEWRFEPWSRETGMDRAADNHYPTSPLAVIKARDVASISAPDAVLFLWATVPMLSQALDVMAAWGFTYKSNFVWIKDRAGTGFWNRNQHELLLIGTRGKIPAPAPGTQWPSVIEAPRREHSRKPDAVFELIESYFPNLPRIELNRRGPPRPNWSAWGNEVTDADDRRSVRETRSLAPSQETKP